MLDHLSTLFPARQREPRRKLMRLQTFSMYPARRADRCIHRPVPQPVAAEHKRQYQLVYGVSCFLADKGTVPYSDVRFQQMAMPDFMAQRRREAAIRCDPFSTLRHSRQSRDNVAHVATCRTLGKRTSGVNTLGLHGGRQSYSSAANAHQPARRHNASFQCVGIAPSRTFYDDRDELLWNHP